MHKLVLIRHGQSLWNSENRFTGWKDIDLSEQGRAEAKQAGELLKAEGYTFDEAYTSVLKRAIRTLYIVLDEMDLMWIPVTKSWLLNERHYGGLQGLNKAETAAQYGEEQVLIGEAGTYPDAWSSDGKYLLYEKAGGAQTKIDLWILPMTGDRVPFPYLESPFEEAHSQFSPDGKWVAYTSNESGRSEVYVQSFPIGGGKWQISTAGGDQAQWRSDGKELFYIAPDRNLMVVSIDGGSSLSMGRPTALFQTLMPLSGITDDRNNYVPSKDGQRFLVNTLAESANSQPLVLVLNWAGEIKK